MTRIITIGLDCATWDLINPWANAQELPNFMRLIKKGTTANLKSTYLPQSQIIRKNIGHNKIRKVFFRDEQRVKK